MSDSTLIDRCESVTPAHAVAGGRALERTAFVTSRMMDFCSQKELVAQTGHAAADWPLVVVKELMDNALDACEDAGVAPAIRVQVDAQGITVADNGPGIPGSIIRGIGDFTVRVSSREAYIAPDRGKQGNAFKTLLAMPFVLDGERGGLHIVSNGVTYNVQMRLDRVRQQPLVEVATGGGDVRTGTAVTVQWPDSALLNPGRCEGSVFTAAR